MTAQGLTTREWIATLFGLGLVVCSAVLIEATPRREMLQIAAILLASLLVSWCVMVLVRFFSRNPAHGSVSSQAEGMNDARRFDENHA